MTDFAQTLIYVHAGFGGLALLAGAVSLIATKRIQRSQKIWLGVLLQHVNFCLYGFSYFFPPSARKRLFVFNRALQFLFYFNGISGKKFQTKII